MTKMFEKSENEWKHIMKNKSVKYILGCPIKIPWSSSPKSMMDDRIFIQMWNNQNQNIFYIVSNWSSNYVSSI